MESKPEIYYLVGALRDGCLTSQWTIKIKQKDRRWLSDVLVPIIHETFGKQLKNNIYFQNDKYPVWYLAFKDKKIWNLLKSTTKRSPETFEEKLNYIKAFWDADGGCPKNPTRTKKIYIKFTQKDKRSLDELKTFLEADFGIKCGRVRISEIKSTGNIWRFTITNKDGIQKFCNKIGSLHPEKKQRLEKITNLLSTR